MNQLPRISIVTPSFNQAEFLEETILSVIEQDYPSLEYIVMDGGSSDNSAAILERYADRLSFWTSVKDNGQADALNKGFRRATGDIVGYLNSDDLYLPGSLAKVAEEFTAQPACRWLTGSCVFFGGDKKEELFRPVTPENQASWLRHWVIPQPAVFWRRELFAKHGFLDESFHYCMDYEFWLRLLFGGERCHFIDHTLAKFRLHQTSKTVGAADAFAPEAAAIRERFRGMLSPDELRQLKASETKDLLLEVAGTAKGGSRIKALEKIATAAKRAPASVLTREFRLAVLSFVQGLNR